MNTNKKIFAENLKRYVEQYGKTHSEIAQAIGISKSTFSAYINGESFPRIDKIQALADLFNIPKSALVEQQYYIDMDIKELAQELIENPKARELFMTCKELSDNDMELISVLIDRLRRNDT